MRNPPVRTRAAESVDIRRTGEKVELEERGTPHTHPAKRTAPIRAAEKLAIRVDRREKTASLKTQREMGAHRHAHPECQRYRKARVFMTENRIRAEARDAETAREIRLQERLLIERHRAADVQIFDVNTGGGEGICAQRRGLPTVEQLVLGGRVGACIEREREGAVVIQLDVLAGVNQLEAAADAVTNERTHFELLCLAHRRLRRGGRAHEHGGAEQQGTQWRSRHTHQPTRGTLWNKRLAVPVSAETLARANVWDLTTDAGRLDLIFKPSGTQGNDELARSAVTYQAFGIELRAVSLKDILRSKRASNPAQDQQDVIILTEMLKRR